MESFLKAKMRIQIVHPFDLIAAIDHDWKKLKEEKEKEEIQPDEFLDSFPVQNLKKEKKLPAVNKVPVHGNEQSSASWTTANGNINAIPVPVVNESELRLRSEE